LLGKKPFTVVSAQRNGDSIWRGGRHARLYTIEEIGFGINRP
jgi:hypothetical protein